MPDCRIDDDDLTHLRSCLELAARARGATSPNPMVGAVVVRDGEVVGRGWHRRAGEPHAERIALGAAGDRCRGATLYTSMEPCCHQGRTPPCTEAIIDAGIARVVSCTVDPDPRVHGKGFATLREAGIVAGAGALQQEAARLNEGYLTLKRAGRPFVVGKAALSLDGRLATRTGSSQWITGPEARQEAHRLRAGADAVVVGIGTALADDPRLTARHGGGPGPRFRVVLDSRLRMSPDSRLLAENGGSVVVVTTRHAPEDRRRALLAAGAEVVPVAEEDGGRVSLRDAFQELGRRGIARALLEGGGAVLTSAFELDIIDKLVLFYAPLLIGGSKAPTLWAGRGIAEMADARRLRDVRVRRLGSDWSVEGYVHPPEPPR
ncbi:MAG: bifunctional diaminohydroxyphosphoribosylaminopyrimidine deaminase/5-amino-6-(5-phosphoribosylamino)uracil reductase RibD [Acidobacteriota bacterium]